MKIGNKTYEGLHITSEYGNTLYDQTIEEVLTVIKPGGKIIDIGANLGVYSIAASQILPYSEFILFEPVYATAEYATSNLSKCGIKHTLNCIALSNYIGEGYFAISQMHQTNKFSSIGEKVKVSTLDSYAYNEVSFIKIDVEGHELQVLEGAVNTIKINKPVVLLEYHKEADWNKMKALIEEELNYKIVQLSPPIFDINACNNLMLVPKD